LKILEEKRNRLKKKKRGQIKARKRITKTKNKKQKNKIKWLGQIVTKLCWLSRLTKFNNIMIHQRIKITYNQELLTFIPLYPRRSPSPPATRTNAAFWASLTPVSSKLIKLLSPKVKTSPFGT